MPERPSPSAGWRDAIPPLDRAVYEASGHGRRDLPGRRPALVIIDVAYGFVGRVRAPILESIKTYPNSCGAAGWDAIGPIAAVLSAARGAGAPVYFTGGLTVPEEFAEHRGRWREKHPVQQPIDAQEIVAELAGVDGDIVIRKTKPSVFHGTPFVGSLIDHGVDTLIVAGCTTSTGRICDGGGLEARRDRDLGTARAGRQRDRAPRDER